MNDSFLKELISCARGEIPSDLLIVNGTLVNVITHELYEADIAIYRNLIANVAEPNSLDVEKCRKLIDAKEKFISPGLIESHLHIESTMLTPNEFAKVVVPRGTTTVLLDPHEIGNVLGVRGLELLLSQSDNLPLRFLIEIPSCVPAAPSLETPANVIDSKTIENLIENEPRFFGLGEVMNYPGVLLKDTEVLAKINLGANLNVIDGHCPGLSGRNLDAYISTGIASDHEITTPKEFLEKLRKGMKVMIREGSFAKNLRNILKVLSKMDLDLRNCLFASDDLNIIDLYLNGHLDMKLRIAVEEKISPITALQMVTINTATYLGLEGKIGSISPGKIADIVIFKDIQKFDIDSVIFEGNLVFNERKLNWRFTKPSFPSWSIDTVKLVKPINLESFRIVAPIPQGSFCVRVIGVKQNSLITEALEENLICKNGWIRPQPERDILSLSVLERYGINGNIANGFIKGFGIEYDLFAMATTVAHDCHNIIVTGTNHQIMVNATKKLQEINGGYVVIVGNKIQCLPLPYGGLMSTGSYETLYNQLTQLNKSLKEITDFNEPLMALSFMALPVIPHLKLTDKGLVDVNNFTLTDIIVP